MNIIQPNWNWPQDLQTRDETKYCVWHHTACQDQMQPVQDIWQEHIDVGDNGIAYNRLIQGDGMTNQGRPDDAVSAAAHGVNYCSIDIVVEGNFEASLSDETPTDAQVQATKDNKADIDALYPGIQHIGHFQAKDISGDPSDATACPGSTLIKILQDMGIIPK